MERDLPTPREPARSPRRDKRAIRGLTTRGRCLVAGGGAAVLCALLLDERDLLRLGILAVAMPLVALAVNIGRRTSLSASHQILPDRLRPGGQGTVRLMLTNRSRSRSRRIDVTDPAIADLTRGVRSVVPALPAGATGVVTYPLVAQRRGRFRFPSPTIRMGDPFGLWEEHRALPCTTEVLVVPTVVALTGMPSAAGARSAAAGSARSGSGGGDPDVQVRHYTPGDDIRTIHWRASARRDDLMVRLREPVAHGGVTVVLDHRERAHHGSGAQSTLETAVTVAASLCMHLVTSDYQLGLVSHTGAVIASGNDIADDILAALAEVEKDPIGAIAPDAIRQPGLVLAVLGTLDPSDAATVAAARSRSSRAIAFLVGDDHIPEGRTGYRDGTGAASSAVAAASILRAAGWTTVHLRPGEDFASLWRGVCDGTDVGAFPAATAASGTVTPFSRFTDLPTSTPGVGPGANPFGVSGAATAGPWGFGR